VFHNIKPFILCLALSLCGKILVWAVRRTKSLSSKIGRKTSCFFFLWCWAPLCSWTFYWISHKAFRESPKSIGLWAARPVNTVIGASAARLYPFARFKALWTRGRRLGQFSKTLETQKASTYEISNLSVNTFYFSISLRYIWSCESTIRLNEIIQLTNHFILAVTSLNTDVFWKTRQSYMTLTQQIAQIILMRRAFW